MTETVAKLWGWRSAKEDLPNLRGLCHVPSRSYNPSVESALFQAVGIPVDEIEWVVGGVKIDSYVSSSMLWQNLTRYHFHPELKKTWSELRAGLVEIGKKTSPCIFVSRRHPDDKRSCRNLPDVESAFRSHGFEIVYPETLRFVNRRLSSAMPGSWRDLLDLACSTFSSAIGLTSLLYFPTTRILPAMNSCMLQRSRKNCTISGPKQILGTMAGGRRRLFTHHGPLTSTGTVTR